MINLTKEPAKVTNPRQVRFLQALHPNAPFTPIGEWQSFAKAEIHLADHIAHNLPTQSVTGEPRYWSRISGHNGFCEVK